MLLVVGNAASADGLFVADSAPEAQDVGVLKPTERAWFAGGSAAAIAIAAAGVYGAVRLWHPLPGAGASTETDELRAALHAAGVDLSYCPAADAVVRAVVVDSPSGRLAWSEPPISIALSTDDVQALLDGVTHVVFAPRWGQWSERILAEASVRGIPRSIVGEIPPSRPGWAIAVADHRQFEANDAGQVDIRVATRGSQGATIQAATARTEIAALPITPVDTTGAGDTFGGAFIGATLSGLNAEAAGRYAATAAAAACMHWGAIPLTTDRQKDETQMIIDQSMPLTHEQLLSRTEGALWGQACGDAFGMPNSFLKFPVWRTAMEAGPLNSPFHAGYVPGRVTDDTEQAQSLTAAFEQSDGPLDVQIVAAEIGKWLDSVGGQDSLAVGPSTKRAMAAISAGTPVELAGRTGVTNGAPMRVSVVGAWAALNDFTFDELLADIEASCVPTHNTGVAISGAAAVAAAVWAGIRGLGWDETLAQALTAARWGADRGNWLPAVSIAERISMAVALAEAATSEADAARILTDLVGMGEATTESVPAAFAAAAYARRDPEVAIRVAGNARGDTDTVAAMAGAIAGATAGPDALPTAWRDIVADTNSLDVAAWAKTLVRAS